MRSDPFRGIGSVPATAAFRRPTTANLTTQLQGHCQLLSAIARQIDLFHARFILRQTRVPDVNLQLTCGQIAEPGLTC